MNKLLIIGTKNLSGGGSVAACALFESLKDENFDIAFYDISTGILYANDFETFLYKSNANLLALASSLLLRAISKALKLIHVFPDLPLSWDLLGIYDIHRVIQITRPDIVNVHWLGNNYIRFWDFTKLAVPVVLTLHDLWPISGLRHISFPVHKNIVDPYSRYPLFLAIDSFFEKRKIACISSAKHLAVIVSPSSFVDRFVTSALSKLGHQNNIANHVIPNIVRCIPRNIPSAESFCRMPSHSAGKKINILFGGSGNASALFKGYHHFFGILHYVQPSLERSFNLNVLLLGSASKFFSDKKRQALHSFDFEDLGNDIDMSAIIDQVDIYCSTSVSETFGLLAAEMVAECIDVIAFGGMGSDYIAHNYSCPSLNLIPDFSLTLYARCLSRLIEVKYTSLDPFLGSADITEATSLSSRYLPLKTFCIDAMNEDTVRSYLRLFRSIR